jgi:hypothetical protein
VGDAGYSVAGCAIGFGRAVSRILSSPGSRRNGENHLSQQPVPETCFTFAKRGAGRSSVSYLALHPMGFSVPRRLRFARCALTAPFHPYLRLLRDTGGLFSVALSVGTPRGVTARMYPNLSELGLRGIAPFGVRTFLPRSALRNESDSPPFQNQGYGSPAWMIEQEMTLNPISEAETAKPRSSPLIQAGRLGKCDEGFSHAGSWGTPAICED